MIDLEPLVGAYYKLLQAIDWEDELLIAGLREGLNKFPSNAFLSLHPNNKYLSANYYSQAALRKVEIGQFSGLIFEHMVPKTDYIQSPCEMAARDGTLSRVFIRDLFDKYWRIAIITAEENRRLQSRTMPANWDREDIFTRYREADIVLWDSPF